MASVGIGTFYGYANGSDYGRYSCTLYWDSTTRSGTTVYMNNARVGMSRYNSGYTTNRIAGSAGINGGWNNVSYNATLNAKGSQSPASMTYWLGTPSLSTTGTSFAFRVEIASTGWSGGWDNFQSSNLVWSGSIGCPAATTSVSQSLNSKTPTTIKMNWSTGNTADYIWYSINGGSSWTAVGGVNASSGTYTISGLSPNTTYSIKTQARRKDTGVSGNISGATSVTTYKAYSVVSSASVTNIMPFTCTAVCTSSNASNTNQYEYALCDANKTAISGQTFTTSVTSYNFTGLAEETSYYMRFRVKSTDSGVWSDYVYSSLFTTPADQVKGYIKANNSWRVGKVFMKINGSWVKTKKVYIKNNGSWIRARNP